jgi:ubiquitin C-terminal hydrolase
LVIDIKRFNTHTKKNQILVTFPLEDLDLSKYVIGYKKESYVYDLYGICNHMGGTTGGHYTAFVKNAENKWNHYNDRSVESVGNVKDIITPLAYCLFYRKKNNFL